MNRSDPTHKIDASQEKYFIKKANRRKINVFFFNYDTKSTSKTLNKLGIFKIKNVCTSKDTVNKVKDNSQNGKNICKFYI